MRKSGIAELLGDVKETITVIDNEYTKANEDLSVKEFFKIRIKHALEDMRSCLDYVANDIYDEIFYANDGSKKPDIHFPYGKDENAFKSMLGRYFKDLKEKNNELYDEIISIQPFKCGSMWLYDLCKTTNTNKHEDLLGQDRKTKADLNIAGANFGFDNFSENGTVLFTGCTFNGIKQKDDIIIQNGKLSAGNNEDIVDFEMDTKFFFKDTDINCIDLVKDSYSGILKFVDEVYRILNK